MLLHGFDRLCNRNQCLRLTKWFAAGEGHTGQQRILSDALQDLLHISNMAACKIMGLRIMAAGTMMGTSLCKDHITDAGTIHDRILDGPGDPKLFRKGCV